MDSVSGVTEPLSNLRLSIWASVGVSALLVYDIITTLDEEVKYFWASPLSWITPIFILIRYGALLTRRSIASIYFGIQSANTIMCYTTIWGASLLDWAIILCMDYILFLRVRALYSFETRHKKIILSIQVLFFVNVAVSLGGLIVARMKAGVIVRALSNLNDARFCDTVKNPAGLWSLCWSAPLIYDSILMGLVLCKATHVQKSLGFRGTKLVRLLVIDQAMYFVLVMLSSVSNIVANSIPMRDRSTYIAILYAISGAQLLSLQGSRMLIRLREAAEKRSEAGMTLRITSNVTNVQFRTYTADEGQRASENLPSSGV